MNCKHKKYIVLKSKEIKLNENDYVIEETRRCIICYKVFKERIL